MPIMKISKRKVYEDCEPFPEPFPHHKVIYLVVRNNIPRNIQIFTVHNVIKFFKFRYNIKSEN